MLNIKMLRPYFRYSKKMCVSILVRKFFVATKHMLIVSRGDVVKNSVIGKECLLDASKALFKEDSITQPMKVQSNKHGAPVVVMNDKQFDGQCIGSISHKDNVVATVALKLNEPSRNFTGIGIDIEHCVRNNSAISNERFARRILTDLEIENLEIWLKSNGDVCSFEEALLLIFSMKESIFKAIHGIVCRHVPMKEVEVRLPTLHSTNTTDEQDYITPNSHLRLLKRSDRDFPYNYTSSKHSVNCYQIAKHVDKEGTSQLSGTLLHGACSIRFLLPELDNVNPVLSNSDDGIALISCNQQSKLAYNAFFSKIRFDDAEYWMTTVCISYCTPDIS